MLSLRRQVGFSLIELMLTVTLVGVMAAWAIPSFTTWIRNAKVRSAADALQSGVRLAQAEAQRRARSVVFFRTASKACDGSATASVGGTFWQVRVVPNPLITGDTAVQVQCGVLSDVSGFKLNGPAALCFSSEGRQATLTNPANVGVDCAPGNTPSVFDILPATSGTEDRPLRVLVTLAGSIRMCDPNKALASSPDGCP